MLRSVFLKTLREGRRALIGWSVGVFLTVTLIAALYPSVRENAAEFSRVIEQLPPGVRAVFVGQELDFTSPEGYLNGRLFSFMAPLLFLIFAVRLGSAAIAGEEADGTLDLLLSAPIRRWRVVVEKAAAMVVATALVAAAFWAALALSAWAFDVDVPLANLVAATVGVALLGLAFGAVALAAGAATGERGLAVAVAGTVAAISYLLNSLAPLVGGLGEWTWLSPFRYYTDVDALRHGLDPVNALVLALIACGCGGIAAAAFERRDVGV